MKIRFLLLNAYTVGGTVRTVVTQANALAAAGHEVEITSVWRQREKPAFAIDPRIALRPLIDTTGDTPAWRRRMEELLIRGESRLVPRAEVRYERFNRLTDRRIVRYLRELEGGVLVTTRPALNLLSARFGPVSVARVGQEHMHYAHHKRPLAREIDRWYPHLDAVTVLTSADEADYRTALAGTGVRIEHIPNPLACTSPAPSPLDRPLLLSAGRLVKPKGFATLIEAFAEVVRDHPDWQLRIFGSGPERDRLRKLIHRKHLYNHVYLMGASDRLDEELAKASAFALASRHEGFGMVLAEAMSHGVPVVSFDCPSGPREIISHGEDGLLVPLGDISGLAARIRRLVEDEQLRRAMGERAAASARRYAMDRILLRWEALFTGLLRDREQPPDSAAPARGTAPVPGAAPEQERVPPRAAARVRPGRIEPYGL